MASVAPPFIAAPLGLPRAYWVLWLGQFINRLGGFVGFTRYIAVIEKDRSMSFMDEVHFDQSSDGEAGFASKWRIFCKA